DGQGHEVGGVGLLLRVQPGAGGERDKRGGEQGERQRSGQARHGHSFFETPAHYRGKGETREAGFGFLDCAGAGWYDVSGTARRGKFRFGTLPRRPSLTRATP